MSIAFGNDAELIRNYLANIWTTQSTSSLNFFHQITTCDTSSKCMLPVIFRPAVVKRFTLWLLDVRRRDSSSSTAS